MATFFRIHKPQYYGESELRQREKESNVSGKTTLHDWIRGSANASDARVFISSEATPNALTRINDHDVRTFLENDDGWLPLLSNEDRFIKEVLEKNGLSHYRMYKYIRMFANFNGFSAAGQIAIRQTTNPNKQSPKSPIHTENARYSFIVKDRASVQYIEESDIVLNPTHEYSQGETIARLKVVSTISANENNEIQHSFDSASLVPCLGKKHQCVRHFGDNRTMMKKLTRKLEEIFTKFVAMFKTIKQNDEVNNATSNFVRCRM